MNASHAIDYLRSIGVHISDRDAAEWNTQEQRFRDERRRNRRELKKSCGHFNTNWTFVISDAGCEEVKSCSDCRVFLESRPAPRTPPRGGGGEPLPVERIA